MWSESLKQIPSDPGTPAGANEIINFQLEGILKTSRQLLLELLTKSQTTDSRYVNDVRSPPAHFNHFAADPRSVDILTWRSTHTAVQCVHRNMGYEIQGYISLPCFLDSVPIEFLPQVQITRGFVKATQYSVALYELYCQLYTKTCFLPCRYNISEKGFRSSTLCYDCSHK